MACNDLSNKDFLLKRQRKANSRQILDIISSRQDVECATLNSIEHLKSELQTLEYIVHRNLASQLTRQGCRTPRLQQAYQAPFRSINRAFVENLVETNWHFETGKQSASNEQFTNGMTRL